MLKKKLTIFFSAILLFNLISSLTISDVSLGNDEESVFINGSVNLDKLEIKTNDINLFSIISTATITNLLSSSSGVSFYSLTNPYNDIKYSDGTIIARDINFNTTILIDSLKTILLGDFDVTTTTTTTTGGGGGGFGEVKLHKINYTYDKWIKGGLNEIDIFIYDIEENLFDPDFVGVEIENVFYEKNHIRLDKGEYRTEFIIKDDLDEVTLKIHVEDAWKNIYEEVLIELEKPTQIEKVREKTEIKLSKLEKLFNWTEKISINVFIFLLLLLLILLGITSYKLYKKRKRKV